MCLLFAVPLFICNNRCITADEKTLHLSHNMQKVENDSPKYCLLQAIFLSFVITFWFSKNWPQASFQVPSSTMKSL